MSESGYREERRVSGLLVRKDRRQVLQEEEEEGE